MGDSQLQLRRKKARRGPQGFSLLEMVLAGMLMVGVLVPSLVVVRDAMSKSHELHRRNLLANYAVHLLEEQSAITAANWNSGTVQGTLASVGHPTLRYAIARSDSPTNGGLEDRLMHIQVTVFDDVNGNAQLDTNEPKVLYRTKIANLESYTNESP